MESLTIIHRGRSVRKKIVGACWILIAIIFLILGRGSFETRDLIRSILFLLIGAIFFTPLVGFDKTQIEIEEGFLKIIWINRISKIIITETEIENIILSGKIILINRKGKKTLRLDLYDLSKEQKTKIYEFMIDYAQQKNIDLKK